MSAASSVYVFDSDMVSLRPVKLPFFTFADQTNGKTFIAAEDVYSPLLPPYHQPQRFFFPSTYTNMERTTMPERVVKAILRALRRRNRHVPKEKNSCPGQPGSG